MPGYVRSRAPLAVLELWSDQGLQGGKPLATQLFRPAAVGATRYVFSEVAVPAPLGLWLATLLGCAAATFLIVAAFLIEVPDPVRAPGVLMPATGVVQVRAPVEGRIEQLYVLENERVLEGQPLLDVSRDRATTSAHSLRRERSESLAYEQRLIRDATAQRDRARQIRKAAVQERLQHLEDSLTRLESLERLAQSRHQLTEQRLERIKALGDRGALAPDQLDLAKGEVARAEAARLDAASRIADAGRNLDMAHLDARELEEQRVADRIDTEIRLAGLRNRELEIADSAERRLLAPAGGRVIRLAVRVGDIVHASRSLLAIAPDASELEARIYVSASEASGLRRGQAVRLFVDGPSDVQTETLMATLTAVGGLAMTPQDVSAPIILQGPAFEMRARLTPDARASLRRAGANGVGLALRADILRERRSLAAWIAQVMRGR